MSVEQGLHKQPRTSSQAHCQALERLQVVCSMPLQYLATARHLDKVPPSSQYQLQPQMMCDHRACS